jgi:flagellar biosynthesis protein FlhF
MGLQSATVLAFPSGARSAHLRLTTALKYHRLPDCLAETIAREVADFPQRDLEDALAAVLAAHISLAPLDLQMARGILLIGPSGAGKSAVAAKLARAAALAGREVECSHANDGLALLRTATQSPTKLTIMEADGFNPINARARSAFACLSAIEGVESIGVVSALGDAEETAETVAALRFRRIIVTGLDRTRRLGATLAAITGPARLAHITAGPRPDDPLETLTAAVLAKMLLETVN